MDFALPPVGEGLVEVELTRWLVNPGDGVQRGQALAEVMSDKASMEVPAPFAGTITEVLGAPGDKISVGATLLRYTPSDTQAEPETAPAAKPEPTAAPVNGTPSVQHDEPGRPVPAAAPSVRLLARKLGIDLARVSGSGPAGRILVSDLADQVSAPATSPDLPRRPAPPPPDYGTAGTRMKIVGLRRKIAEQLVAAKKAPHFSYVDEVNLSELVSLRGQLKETFAHAGIKLTFLPFLVKAVALALAEVPVVNATFDEASGDLVLHAEVHIGVAVAAPAGLVVPVVRDAGQRDIASIAAEIERLANAVRTGRVTRAELADGTFTVSSIGGIGGLIATPILNAPQVGILAIGKLVRRPVFDSHGAVVPADMAYLSFSFDHRFIDGAVAAHFGNCVIRHLTHPAKLLLPARLGS